MMEEKEKEERRIKFPRGSSIFLDSFQYFVYVRVKVFVYNLYYNNVKHLKISYLKKAIFNTYQGDGKEGWCRTSLVGAGRINNNIDTLVFEGRRLIVKQYRGWRCIYIGKEWEKLFKEWKEEDDARDVDEKMYRCPECLIYNVIRRHYTHCRVCLNKIEW